MRIHLDTLDKVFSEYIRRRNYHDGQVACEYCGKVFYDETKGNGDIYPAWRHLQCSHFYGRGNKSTRVYEPNVAAVCFSCHQYLGGNPREHHEWFLTRLGKEKLEELTLRSNSSVKWNKAKKEELKIYWREKLKELE